jgi:hypothetical protein
MAAHKKVDWSLIEPYWRAGILSVQQLADGYKEMTGVSVTKAAISKHFNQLDVPRNLKDKITQTAEALADEAMVSGKVSGKVDKSTKVSELETINANAVCVAEVMFSQRLGAIETAEIGKKLKADLMAVVSSRDLLEQLGELMQSPDEAGIDKMNEAYRRTISLPGLVDTYKKLVDAEEKANANARRAFNIKDEDGEKETPRVTEIRLIAVRPGYGRVLEHE